MTALLETILNESNINIAIKNVIANKGASGIDNMKVEELPEYFALHGEDIKEAIRNRSINLYQLGKYISLNQMEVKGNLGYLLLFIE